MEPSFPNRFPGGPPRGAPAGVWRRFERLARTLALVALCVLVWWFSYDHGRQTARARVARLEAENVSLREKVVLQERELGILSERLAAAAAPAESGSPDGSPDAAQAASSGAAYGASGAGSDPAAEDSARARLAVKLSENKGAFGGRVVVTLVELDSFDQEALVRIHFRDTGRRLAQLMVPGDVFELEVDGEPHALYLDQIRGALAFFIIDGLPGG